MKIDTSEYFKDGRIKLKVIFRDKYGHLYEWVPRWEEVKALYIEAKRVEEINTKTMTIIFKGRKAEVAKRVAGFLETWIGNKHTPVYLGFCKNKKDCRNKGITVNESITYVLNNASTLEEFKNTLEHILLNYNPENPANLLKNRQAPGIIEKKLNNILSEIGLKVKYLGNGRWKVDYIYPIHILSQE